MASNIAIKIGGDTTDLKSALEDGKKNLAKFKESTKNAMEKASTATKVASAAFAAMSVAVFKASTAAAKEIDRLSSVAGMSASQFQKLSFAAKTYGIEQEKVSDIMKDVNDKIGDFIQNGAGPMKDFFDNIGPKVGVTVDQFKNLSGPAAMQLYINSLEKANLSQAEMTFYMEAIGSDATALLPLFKNNGAALQELSQKAEKMNAVLSDTDVQKLKESADSFDNAKKAVGTLAMQISAQFAPVIAEVSRMITQFGNNTVNTGSIAIKVFGAVMDAVGFMGNAIRGIEVIIEGIKTAVQGLRLVFVLALEGIAQSIDFVVNAFKSSMNAIIDGMNMIPGVDISKMVVGESEFYAQMKMTRQKISEELGGAVDDFHNKMMEPLPSGSIDQFVERVNSAAQQAAEVAVAQRNEAFNLNSIQDQLTEEVKDGESKRQKIYDFFASEKLKTASSLTNEIGKAMRTGSEEQFEIGKKLSMASAIIDGIAAGVGAYKHGASIGGPWVGAGYAAISALQTGAMIAQIDSMSYNSKTKPSAPPAASTPPPNNQQAGGVLTVQGLSSSDLITGDTFMDLMKRITDYQKDGGTVVFA